MLSEITLKDGIGHYWKEVMVNTIPTCSTQYKTQTKKEPSLNTSPRLLWSPSSHPYCPPQYQALCYSLVCQPRYSGEFFSLLQHILTQLRPLTKSPFRLTLLDLWKASIYHLCIFRVPLRRPDRGSLSNENISRRHKKSNSQDMDKSTTNIFVKDHYCHQSSWGQETKAKGEK